jgi:cytochrome c5
MIKRILQYEDYLLTIGRLASLLVGLGGLLHAQEGGGASPAALPDGEGKELVSVICSQCHSTRSALLLRNGQEGWRSVVDRMITNGARISSDEADTIVHYLFANFGPGKNVIRTGPLASQEETASGAKEISLPAGPGKDVVEARCGICHDVGWIVHTKRSKQEWEAVTKNMIGRGPQAPAEQVQTIITYLTTHFGKGSN